MCDGVWMCVTHDNADTTEEEVFCFKSNLAKLLKPVDEEESRGDLYGRVVGFIIRKPQRVSVWLKTTTMGGILQERKKQKHKQNPSTWATEGRSTERSGEEAVAVRQLVNR